MPTPRSDLALIHLVRPAQAATDSLPPLLLQLHGVGSNEADLFSFAGELDPRFVVVSARAPFTRALGSYAWYDVDFLPNGDFRVDPAQMIASRDRIAQFIGEAVAAYGADPARVYLNGFSQGAIMSLALSLTQPDLVAGAACMSGRLLPDVIPLIAPPDQLTGLPIFMAHGLYDAVIPIANAREARAVLQTLPVALDYNEYPMRHEIGPQAFFAMRAWLGARLDGPRRIIQEA